METPNVAAFEGFPKGAFRFLKGLAKNNNREWFEAHKGEYLDGIVAPMRCLVSGLSDFMQAIDWNFEVAPCIGKTISRIYKDARYSWGRTPYKETVWCSFKQRVPQWKTQPGYFFEVSAEGYCFGMGYFEAKRETMDRLRSIIDERPDDFRKVLGFMKKKGGGLTLGGFRYKRLMKPGVPDDLLEFYQRKSFYFISERPVDGIVTTKKLVKELMDAFASMAPLYHFMFKLSL